MKTITAKEANRAYHNGYLEYRDGQAYALVLDDDGATRLSPVTIDYPTPSSFMLMYDTDGPLCVDSMPFSLLFDTEAEAVDRALDLCDSGITNFVMLVAIGGEIEGDFVPWVFGGVTIDREVG